MTQATCQTQVDEHTVGAPNAELPGCEKNESGWINNDPDNPINWPLRKKWMVTGFSCTITFLIGINALSISSAAVQVGERFDVSDAAFPNSYWVVTAWNVGAAIMPLFGLPLLENFGVRLGYLSSCTFFVIFIIPQAVARNFATLIVSRFFAGGFGGIVMNAVANIIGDIWVDYEMSLPVTLFTFTYLLGFTIGPVIGSAILNGLYWRWILYIQLMVYGTCLPLGYFLIPETRGAIILARRVRKNINSGSLTQHDGGNSLSSFLDSLYKGTGRAAYLFCTEPIVFFFTLWSAMAVGNIFIATQSIGQTYGADYGFDGITSGYLQGSLAVGEIIGLPISLLQNRMYKRSAFGNEAFPGRPIPESRLTLAIPASFLAIAGGLFIYAWTSYPSIPWIVPTIGLTLTGIGIMVVVNAAVAYITDAYGIYSGSAIAAAASIENLFSAFLPLAAQAMYTKLGFQWASSLLGFLAVLLGFAPIVLYIAGPSIRARSKFMTNTK